MSTAPPPASDPGLQNLLRERRGIHSCACLIGLLVVGYLVVLGAVEAIHALVTHA